MDIISLNNKLRKKEVSSKELVLNCINKLEKLDKKYHFLMADNFDNAIKKASEVDEKIAKGIDLNILSGIPCTIKDNIMTEGIVSTSGTKIMDNFVPPYNASVVDELNNKDAIILCKVNMDELGAGGETRSEFMQTLNPYNVEESVSGSSGGSAVSVAIEGCSYSLGTDTGGSVREPAEKCGIIGMKPTYGSISRFGVASYANSLDQVGFITNTVKDVAILMEEVAKQDVKDVLTFKRNYANLVNSLKKSDEKIKVGIIEEIEQLKGKKEVEFYFDFVKQLEKEPNIELVKVSFPYLNLSAGVYKTITSVEGYSNFNKYDGLVYTTRKDGTNYIEVSNNSRKAGFSERVKTKIVMGDFLLREENKDIVNKAYTLKDIITNYFDTTLQNLHTILLPMESFHSDIYLTAISNIAGTPAIQLPVTKNDANVPQGIQLVGRRFNDAELLKIAYNFEQMIGFKGGLNV